MSVKLVTKNDVLKLYVKEHTKPIIMQVSASWCKPCRDILPLFKQLAMSNRSIQFLYVDVDKCDEAEKLLNVSALPTFIAYKNHKRIGKVVGDNSEALLRLVKKLNK